MKRIWNHKLPQRRTILLAVLVLLIALCQYSLWLRPSGIPGLARLRAEIAQIKYNNYQNQHRNQVVYQHIQALRHSNAAIEVLARSQLGLIKQGEIFYHVVEKPAGHPGKSADSLASMPPVAKLAIATRVLPTSPLTINKDLSTYAYSRNQ